MSGIGTKPTVHLSFKAYQKMIQYPQKCPKSEVWGLLIGDITDQIVVDDIVMFKHKQSSAARAEPDYVEMQKWMMENEDITGENFERVLGWFHTHINISPSPSGTDRGTIDKIGGHYVITLIASTNGTQYCQIDIKKPCRVCIEDVKVAPMFSFDKELEKEIESDIKDKVVEEKHSYSYSPSAYRYFDDDKHYVHGGYGGWGYERYNNRHKGYSGLQIQDNVGKPVSKRKAHKWKKKNKSKGSRKSPIGFRQLNFDTEID